jgi:hypothetical protein
MGNAVQRTIKRSKELSNMMKSTKCVTGLGGAFGTIARSIKANAASVHTERETYFLSMNGFDTHASATDDLEDKFGSVDSQIAGFEKEMKAQGLWNSIVLVQASEFGRMLTSNGDGTGHGWGGNYFITGGGVKGGQILGDYPDDLSQKTGSTMSGNGRAIPTTSWDQIWSGIAQWYGVEEMDMDQVLPNRKNFPKHSLFTQSDLFDTHVSTGFPTPVPTTLTPTAYPTAYPTAFPTASPTPYPTAYPTNFPTAYPTAYPTNYPTKAPTSTPTLAPTAPTRAPIAAPTTSPTLAAWVQLKVNDQGAGKVIVDTFTPFKTSAIQLTSLYHRKPLRLTEIIAYDPEGNKITPVHARTDGRSGTHTALVPNLVNGGCGRRHCFAKKGATIWFGKEVTIAKLELHQKHASGRWSWNYFNDAKEGAVTPYEDGVSTPGM